MRSAIFYSGKPIRSLQTMLRHISDADPNVLPVVPDGQYGNSTYASVLSFQHAYQLPQTGSTDLFTWNKIITAFDKASPNLTVPAAIPRWSVGRSILPGDFNYHLFTVQAMLAALSDFFPAVAPPAITGTLDPVTQSGLEWVQTTAGLPQTGSLDTATWNYLIYIHRTVIGTGEK